MINGFTPSAKVIPHLAVCGRGTKPLTELYKENQSTLFVYPLLCCFTQNQLISRLTKRPGCLPGEGIFSKHAHTDLCGAYLLSCTKGVQTGVCGSNVAYEKLSPLRDVVRILLKIWPVINLYFHTQKNRLSIYLLIYLLLLLLYIYIYI
jgi:hypothetical protein